MDNGRGMHHDHGDGHGHRVQLRQPLYKTDSGGSRLFEIRGADDLDRVQHREYGGVVPRREDIHGEQHREAHEGLDTRDGLLLLHEQHGIQHLSLLSQTLSNTSCILLPDKK